MINISKEDSLKRIDLRKEEIAKIKLSKPQLSTLARIGLVLDFSGSMSELYRNGTVQEVLEKIFPLALTFDDNGEMECWIFESGFHRLESVTMDNYYGYIQNKIMGKYHMGCTSYAPVMNDVEKLYMKEQPAALPNYIIFITDGNNDDAAETTRTMMRLAEEPIFWQFVGIGDAKFDYLEKLDDMTGRYVDNADFFAVDKCDDIAYEDLLNEFPSWLADPKVTQMITDQNNKEPEFDDSPDSNLSDGEKKKKKSGLLNKIFKH